MSPALIFVGLIALITLGVPIAVALGGISLLAMSDNIPALGLMAQRMYSSTTGFTLLAIPFFIRQPADALEWQLMDEIFSLNVFSLMKITSLAIPYLCKGAAA